MIPMMAPNEVSFLESKLLRSDSVWEYGSGSSTVWLAHRVQHVTSVEHNPVFAARACLNLAAAGRQNTCVLFVPPNGRYEEGSDDDGAAEVFSDYATIYMPETTVVLIDGRARVACAATVARHKPRVVFLHDCQREQYAPVWTTHLREVERVGNLMALVPR